MAQLLRQFDAGSWLFQGCYIDSWRSSRWVAAVEPTLRHSCCKSWVLPSLFNFGRRQQHDVLRETHRSISSDLGPVLEAQRNFVVGVP